MNRRTFVRRAAAGAAGLAAAPGLAASPAIWTRASSLPPSDTVRVGIIGPGSRGKNMMQHFLRVPGVEFVGLADIYEPRFKEARDITGQETPAYDDYRKLLDQASEMDAVIVATPLGHHEEHMIAALEAGLSVYGEKSLALTPEGCDAIRDAVNRTGRLFQIGHQYRYAGWYREAVARIEAGDIGRPTHIYAYWHRNYNWRRPVPEPGLEQLINWRLYRELSGGLLAELGSHHIETANWIFGATPQKAMGTGAVTFYDDGRETFDNVQVLYEYPDNRRLFFSSVIGNRMTGFQLLVHGTTGTVKLTLQNGGMYYEAAANNSANPPELTNDSRYTSPTLRTDGDMPYAGDPVPITVREEWLGDPSFLAAEAFVESLRNGTRPVGDIDVGWGSGYAVAMGNRAMQTGEPVVFPELVME